MMNGSTIINTQGNNADTNVFKELLNTHDKMSDLFYLIACVTGVFLLLFICVVVMLIKDHDNQKKTRDLVISDFSARRPTTKSAPISRTTSPSRKKRLSCPQAYGSVDDAIVRSSTVPNMPGLETEHVQSVSDGDESKDWTALQYQPNYPGTHPHIAFTRDERERNVGETGDATARSPHGRLCFSVLYDISASKLLVTLIKATDLEGRCMDDNYRDPFVKVYLLPNEHSCFTSKVKKKTLDPMFNETVALEIYTEEVEHSSLRFSVYDVDRRRLRHTLGHAIVALRDINVNSSEIVWKDLVQEISLGSSVGEMHLALTYLPHLERLKLVILRARSIGPKPDQDTGYFVRVLQYYGNKLVKSKQTLTQSAVPEINFNESFAFSTSNKSIDNFNFLVTLVQTSRNSLCSDAELGHVSLGSFMFARGAGLIHWQEMLAKTRTVVAKWHQLSVPI